MATRVCVVGSVNLDLVFTVPALPRSGETVLASTMSTHPGGKGANQAVAAARAGARVQFVGAVGDDDAGVRLRAHLAANGVGTDGLVTVAGASGTAVITVDSAAENTIVVAPGVNAALTVDSESVGAIIADCEVLLLQLEIPVATATAAARLGRAAGTTVMVNASPAGTGRTQLAALAALAALTDAVVVNETESAAWVWPVEHRVITRGARGARYLGPEWVVDVPTPTVAAVDTAGAGDVFAGVLAAGWPRERRDGLRRACAAGALATLVTGAGDCAPGVDAINDAVLLTR